MQFVGRNNLPAMKNLMPTSRSATTHITNVTRKSRRSKLVAAPLVGAVIAVGALSGTKPPRATQSISPQSRGATAGAAGQALRRKACLRLGRQGSYRRSESAFGAIGSEIGTGLGQSRTRVSRAGERYKPGDIDAELKETNKKLDTIDADLKVQTAAIQGLNCDVNVGNMNADRARRQQLELLPVLRTPVNARYQEEDSAWLKQQIADWADKALAQDDNGLGRRLIPYSELVRRDDGQNSGAFEVMHRCSNQ